MTDISTCLNWTLKVVSFFVSPFHSIPLSKVGEPIRHEHMPQSHGASTATWFFASYSQNQALTHART